MNEQLEPADIFFTQGTWWVSRAVRFCTRTIGESRTKASHVGIVVRGGSCETAVVVEALERVKEHRLIDQYGSERGTKVAVYRPLGLSEAEVERVVKAARCYLNRKYGWFQLIGHLLDWGLQGAYVFRRFTGSDAYPICSWVVASSFAKVKRYFTDPPSAANPDDIHDFLECHPAQYQLVRQFKPLATD